MASRSFIPALQHDWLTPAYDLLIRVTLPEERFKRALIRSASIAAGHRVLDLGCGTGTLLRFAAETNQEATFVGIDPDPRILERARTKTRDFGARVVLENASATELPFAAETFDRVLSTLMFHHLPSDGKARAMREIHRTLQPQGELHLGDFGEPDTIPMRVVSFLTERIGREHVRENFGGMLPSMLRESGFTIVEETARLSTVFGVLRSLRAVK